MIHRLKNYLQQGKTSSYLIKTFLMYGLIAVSIIITKVLIARFYGQEELGLFSFFFGLVSLVFLFTSFGCPEALTQVIVKNPTAFPDAAKKAGRLILIFSVIVTIPFLTTNFFLPTTGLKINFALYLMTYTFFYLSYSFFRGQKQFVTGTAYSLLNRLLFIGAIFAGAYLSAPFEIVLSGLSVALLLFTLPTLPALLRSWRAAAEKSTIPFREFLLLAFSLFLMQAGFYLLREADLIIIPYLTDFKELGLYSAHSSLSNIIRLIAYVFPVVVLPLAVTSKYKLKRSLTKILLLLIPFSTIILGATYLLVPLLYGPEYFHGTLPLALVLSSAIMVVYSYFNSVFVGENRVSGAVLKIVGLDFVLSLLVNTGLTILLVWSWGIIGAPIATALTVLLKIWLNVYGIKKLRRGKENNGELAAENTTP